MRMRIVTSTLLGIGAAVAMAAPAHGAATSTGSLDLTQDTTSVAYAWQDAPLLTGPAAAQSAGLPATAIRASDSRYLPVGLRSLSWAGPFGAGGCTSPWNVPGAMSAEIVDRRAILTVENVTLDVRRGRGSAFVRLASVGADALAYGEFVATGLLRVTVDGCTDGMTGEPWRGDDGAAFHAVEDLAMFRVSGSQRVAGRFAPDMLDRDPVPLRFSGGAWRGAADLADAASGPYPATRARVGIALAGSPAELHAHCTFPRSLRGDGRAVRTARKARALLRRAGFTRLVRKGRGGGGRGRFWLQDVTSGTGSCDFPVRYRFTPR